MKKFLLLLAVVMVSLAASASKFIYWDNSETGWSGVYAYVFEPQVVEWAKSPQVTTKATIDGKEYFVYEITGNNGAIIFHSTQSGGTQTKNLAAEDGYVYGKANINSTKEIGYIVDGHFTTELNKPVEPTKYFLVGNVTEWAFNDNTLMTETSTGVYTYELASIAANKGFKISTKSYGEQWSTKNRKMELNKAYDAVDGDGEGDGTESALAAAATNVTIEFDYNNKKITVKGEGGEEPVTPPSPTGEWAGAYVNVLFTNNGMANNGTVADENGLNTHKNLAIGDAGFKIKTWRNNTEGDKYWTAGGEIPEGEWAQLYEDGYNQLTFIAGATAESVYDVEYNCETKQVKVTLVGGGDDPNPPTPLAQYYKLHGNIGDGFTGWGTVATLNEANNYTWTGKVQAGEFGIEVWNADDSRPDAKNWLAADGDANKSVAAAGEYKIAYGGQNFESTLAGTYKFVLDVPNLKLTITEEQGEIVTPPSPTGEWAGAYVNVLFTNNGMANNGTAADENGLNTHKNLAIGDAGFKIKTWRNNTEGDKYWTAGGEIPEGEWAQLYEDGYNQLTFIAGATAESVYDVEYNCETKQVKVTLVENPTPTVYTYFIHGEIISGPEDWNDAELVKTGDKYVWTGTVKPGKFGIKKMDGNDQKAWINADGISSVFNAAAYACKVDGTNFQSTLNGEYTFTFDPEKLELAIVAATTGIEGVEAASAEVEYFNLQGIRVANPERGIYFRRQGNTVTKVAL